MHDKIGLHRVHYQSETEVAISLHLYIPPYDHCQIQKLDNFILVSFYQIYEKQEEKKLFLKF
jgi:hypothetical protein